MAKVTILTPTHAERPTLEMTLQSAMQQTERDIEIFVVGDGCPESSKELVRKLQAQDGRIRFFDNPKGERNGESHRHAALAESTAPVVAYLSDDDMLYPDHVSVVLECLRGANFMAPRPCFIYADGTPHLFDGDLMWSWWRSAIATTKRNFMPLTGVAHTMALYRALDEPWSPAPREMWSDLFMWRKFLRCPDFVPSVAPHPTCLIFPASGRREMGAGERAAELRPWFENLANDAERARIERLLLRERQDIASSYQTKFEDTESKVAGLVAEIATARKELQHTRAELDAHVANAVRLINDKDAKIARYQTDLEEMTRDRDAHRQQLQLIHTSTFWRVRDHIYDQRWIREPFKLGKKILRRGR